MSVCVSACIIEFEDRWMEFLQSVTPTWSRNELNEVGSTLQLQ
jgi:hypothetical protein